MTTMSPLQGYTPDTAAAADMGEIGGPLARTLAAAKSVKRWMRLEQRGVDCTGIISARHYERQRRLLDEARHAGAGIVQLDQGGAADTAARRLPMSLVIDPDPNLRIMKEEIFGPILPVIPYDSLDETLAIINRAAADGIMVSTAFVNSLTRAGRS